MTADPFAQLAELEVTTPPPQLQQSVHRRLNRVLFFLHLLEFALRAVPFGIAIFANVMWAFFRFTLKGSYENGRRPFRRHLPRR